MYGVSKIVTSYRDQKMASDKLSVRHCCSNTLVGHLQIRDGQIFIASMSLPSNLGSFFSKTNYLTHIV